MFPIILRIEPKNISVPEVPSVQAYLTDGGYNIEETSVYFRQSELLLDDAKELLALLQSRQLTNENQLRLKKEIAALFQEAKRFITVGYTLGRISLLAMQAVGTAVPSHPFREPQPFLHIPDLYSVNSPATRIASILYFFSKRQLNTYSASTLVDPSFYGQILFDAAQTLIQESPAPRFLWTPDLG